VIVVQQICACYLKSGRGGEEAKRRARLPLGLPLPPWTGLPGYVCHDVSASQPEYDLLPIGLETAPTPPRHSRFLRFDEGIHWRGSPAGAPPRPDLPLELEGRRWIRIRANGRWNDSHYGEFSLWRYVDVTINIGHFESPPSENLFAATEPDRVMDLRRGLW
jgi:hypothetical protein